MITERVKADCVFEQVHEEVTTNEALAGVASERRVISGTTTGSRKGLRMDSKEYPTSQRAQTATDGSCQRPERLLDVWGVGLQYKLPSFAFAKIVAAGKFLDLQGGKSGAGGVSLKRVRPRLSQNGRSAEATVHPTAEVRRRSVLWMLTGSRARRP